MLSKEIVKRVNKIDMSFVPHKNMKLAISKIQRCISLSEGATEPVNFLLTGPGGVGKTTVCNIILSKLKKGVKTLVIREGKEITVVPAFYALVPNPVTIKSVAISMLRSLGAKYHHKGSANDLTYSLGRLLQECETKVIILDEIQHLLKKDMGKTNEVKNWVKSIINEYKVPIVLVGTKNCSSILDEDTQLSRRFKYRVELDNLDLGEHNKKGEFRKFAEGLVMNFNEIVELKSFPDFSSYSSCIPLFAATKGNPNSLVCLFKEACISALIDERVDVNLQDFINAYDEIVLTESITTTNPFRLETSEIISAINNHFIKSGDVA